MTDLSEGNAFLTGWLPGVFIRTAAPIVAITTVNGLFTVVDAYFLGAYVGPDALSAVSLIFPGLMLLIALQSLVSNGMASILARRLGAGNRDGARRVFAGAHALAFAVILVLNLVYWAIGRQIIDAGAAGNATVAHGAMLFMGAMIACAPVSFFLSLHLDGLRCEGKIGFMTLVTLSASLLNILANWLFMAVMHWGVLGSAAGSIASQFVCLAAVLAYRWRRPAALRPSRGLALAEWRGIVAFGAPMSLGFIGISLASAAILINISLWSTHDYVATVAAYGIITRIMTFTYLPLLGLSIALQTVAGNNHGAGLGLRVGRSLQIAMLAALVYCTLVEITVELLAGRLGAVFVADPAIIAEVRRILTWTIGAYFLFGQMLILSSYFQSIGDAPRAAIFGLSRPYLLTLPLTFLLPFVFGEQGIWMVPVFAEAGMFILAFLVLSQNAKRRGWHYGLLPV
ncbi:MATE family efflux transporter [Rhizobium ruizarguesonis]|uniref:Multidrug export protein MepA n=1 Tax=Rhizobium ruizarguesonis TaxID=2081791 RepID=A0AAE4YPX5_9HYPH|nr:MATE family efflux transporter [Rhizobium ruizarguesonis]MBY5807017.1 MATE family efflux transporter [Rhizobium leguminosarum]NKL15059.1 MATE family efflux transporter [Rhizobium leguminosarum bv. viciae]MBY5847248.1 MATE family efflux transporter [Rhizobium leguminosarum]MBY5896409.1 MATE family efflux transporter [Rhizobium leguminosarum]NEH84792.1 MATE family efflux transporter [Rhizobium ruizarguesonis]